MTPGEEGEEGDWSASDLLKELNVCPSAGRHAFFTSITARKRKRSHPSACHTGFCFRWQELPSNCHLIKLTLLLNFTAEEEAEEEVGRLCFFFSRRVITNVLPLTTAEAT